MRHPFRLTGISLCILFLLVACNLPTSNHIEVDPTVIPAIISATSIPATVAPPILGHIKYTLDTIIDYDRHFITVDETIAYPNTSGQALDSLTLAIAANLWPNCFSLKNILVDGMQASGYALNAHRLDIPLQTPLAPGSVSKLNIRYTLSLPYLDQVNSLRARIFGFSDLQLNLVNWYPFIVPNINGKWVIRDPWSHGEYLVYPLADFEVNVVFTDPRHAPVMASSGYAESIGEITRYTLTDGRAFTLSASHDFQVSNMQVGAVTVYSYYFPIYKNAGEAAMIASAHALQVFSYKFGPYPHKTLSVVVADFSDSMEFSALFFHSRKFYDLYDGTPANYLNYIAVHETVHQWWFDQVANDQALEPWLDEALATYSESIYYETLYPGLVSSWWSNRIDFFKPGGYIDIPVYGAENDDAYKQTVYFNGAHFFKDMRDRIGDEAFFAFLQDYYRQEQGRIATGDDFFRILDEHTRVDYSDILHRYFRNR
jgi:hypothetical protein